MQTLINYAMIYIYVVPCDSEGIFFRRSEDLEYTHDCRKYDKGNFNFSLIYYVTEKLHSLLLKFKVFICIIFS